MPLPMTEFESFAIELAAEAAKVTLPFFRGDYSEQNKAGPGDFDPVTEADRGAEAALRRLIGERYPDHGVIGEEYGQDRPDAEHVWILDPIDGTRAFIAGLPVWTTLIALRGGGRSIVGAISQPYVGELFLGGPSGAVLISRGQTRSIRVRECAHLTDAVIATTAPEIFTAPELGAWTQVMAAARLARYGCDAYAYAMVAMGRIDMVAESGLKIWDWSALVPVVEAAGGQVTDWTGQPPSGDGRIIAVGDPRVREQALVAFARAART